MEQEETKTTAAAGAEMPPEAESWVQLHESELTELMQKQAKAAITELKRQEKQERKKEKYHNTFTLMKCYRDAVFHIENAISDGQQLRLVYYAAGRLRHTTFKNRLRQIQRPVPYY